MGLISPIATNPQTGAGNTGGSSKLGLDDFLQLLVTKLQYQDPLKPMDDEDFIAQLAQFSSLEQMNRIADGIRDSNKWDFLQMQSINNTMAAGLIGKDIKASYEGIFVDGESDPTISFTTSQFATEVEITISDENGNVVRRLSMEDVQPGTNGIAWDGKDNIGNSVDPGYYTVEISATSAGGVTVSSSLILTGKVTSIVYRDGGSFLTVNGTEIALGDVTAIGEPGAFSSEEDSDKLEEQAEEAQGRAIDLLDPGVVVDFQRPANVGG